MTKLYRFVPTLLILLGFILVGKSTYYYGKGKLASILLEKAWERTKSEKTVQNPWEWADTHPVGKLTINSVGIENVVLGGVSGEALAFGPGHLSNSSRPGSSGNIVIAGHRDSFFRPLKDIKIGDTIELESTFATQSFTVSEVRPVFGDDIYWIDETENDCITLITCYPFNHVGKARDRFIVRGLIVD
ncbi:MAG: class GN sortase [Candidatus Marinimicrobia bacterium]|jgi:sortase A|nr:class GN sortase [Candidatus Neomarinimicrobiota bacterium]MBT3617172.1 class GN sortase [Candidatus Neomarinimicrobiota bacterium]MBT3829791.1 class GN sortase [Candidatus Neomarinimicrobiota bacterium]MBT3997862.1 class GN sortase [Candidatus Neomarinimicrobiota bacterium]MBT4281240.1 class GN sortase [Candidatus Neomarinimicrobiota bacterium]